MKNFITIMLLLASLTGGKAQGTSSFIVEPDWVQSPNTANWLWLGVSRTPNESDSFELRLYGMSYFNGIPDTGGQITCHRLSGTGGTDTVFQTGFEDGLPLIGGGVIHQSWWITINGQAQSFQTNQLFGTVVGAGWYRCRETFSNGSLVTRAQHTFVIQ